MDSLLKCIIDETTRQYHRLSIVESSDGFLCREDTKRAFAEQADITILSFTQLELRVWFETKFKQDNENRYIVIMEDVSHLIADITSHAFVTHFNTRDLLLTYHQQALDVGKMNYQMMAHLFETKSINILSRAATDAAIGVAESRFGAFGDDISIVKENLMQVNIDWHKPQKTIEEISRLILKAAKQDKFTDIENEIAFINQSFQRHIDDVYYQQLITATAPKVVHKIMPYLSRTYRVGQKLALVVVDGLSYWQYLLLRDVLTKESIKTNDNICYAWLPSVTQLSRQVIFKGSAPDRNYRQNPSNEEKLWRDYWYARNFEEWHVMYAYDELASIPESVERLAYVTMRMDDDMHSAHSMMQLYRDTEDWAVNFIAIIRKILNAGFEIVLTADHGGVPSHAWGNLQPKEKAALYETGSRGQRHLIFNNQDTMRHFIDAHANDVPNWLVHGDSIVWRNNYCFGTDDCITHGGSHMMEMLVPLITIKA